MPNVTVIPLVAMQSAQTLNVNVGDDLANVLDDGSFSIIRTDAIGSVTVASGTGSTEAPILLMVAGQSNSRTAGNSSATPDDKYRQAGALGQTAILIRGTAGSVRQQIADATFEPYDITANADPDNSGTAWGSEAEFIWQMRQAGDMRPVFVVKESQNGQNLANDWSPTETNDNFEFLEAKVARARELVTDAFADEIMLWNQGENDANDDTMSADYAANFVAFLAAFRARVSASALFVAERIRPLGYTSGGSPTATDGYLRAWQVREGTISGALSDTRATVIDTDLAQEQFDAIHPREPWTMEKGLRAFAAWQGTYAASFGPIDDTTPDAFTITAITEAQPGTVISTSPIAIEGIERRTPMSINGGEWRTLNSLDGDSVVQDWTTNAGFVDKYQRLQLRATTSTAGSDTVTVNVDLGGMSVDWTLTTYGSAPTYEAETDAFIAQSSANGGTTIAGTQAQALNTFFTTAKASTWWPKMTRVYARLTDEPASALDLVDQATSLEKVAPFGLPYDWNPSLGWVPQDDANTGIDLKVNPSTDLPQDDCAIGIFYSALSADSRGELNGGPGIFLRALASGSVRYLLNSGGNTNTNGQTTVLGLRAAVRDGPTSLRLHGPDGTILHNRSIASVAPTGDALCLGNARVGNLGGGIHSANASFLGAFAAGQALSEAELQSFATAMDTLHAAFAG